MFKCVLVGLALSAVTVGVHALGTSWWIRHLRRDRKEKFHAPRFTTILKVLFASAIFLLSLHIIEVTIWAIAYLAIPNLDQLTTLEEAVYFSMVTFTSLGYGDIVITNSWRLLSGIQALTGLLIFGWSAALLFAVVQRLWQLTSDNS